MSVQTFLKQQLQYHCIVWSIVSIQKNCKVAIVVQITFMVLFIIFGSWQIQSPFMSIAWAA